MENAPTAGLPLAFTSGKPTADDHIYDSSTYVKSYTYLGTAEETDSLGRCRIEQKNKFSVGETIEVMKPDGQNLEVTVESITDHEGNEQESAPIQSRFCGLSCPGMLSVLISCGEKKRPWIRQN